MNFNWIAIGGALLAGLATGLGALPIYLKKSYSSNFLNAGLGFSGGIMLVASFVSLLLPSISSAQEIYGPHLSILYVLVGLLIGYMFIILIHDYLPHEHIYKDTDVEHNSKASRVMLIILAISLHNLPEGLAVGVGFGAGDSADGMGLAIAIAIQNMPEGLVVAIGLLSEGATRNRAFIMALLSGLVEPLAAVFGYLLTSFSKYTLPVSMSFAAGAMLFVICQEIFPEIFRRGNERSASVGVILGVITMILIDFYLP